jgi:hypothetical protein
MTELAPDYLAALAAQIGGLSAFLGGFAATFLALFLTLGKGSRAASVAVVGSALASVAFILAVIAATGLTAALHPHALPGAITTVQTSRVAMSLSFLVGMAALLVSIGASGWVRSRAMGLTTSGFAAFAMLLAPALLK